MHNLPPRFISTTFFWHASVVSCFLMCLSGCIVVGAQAEIKIKPASDYAECVAQGGKILRTYPGQCVGPHGERFVDPDQNGGPKDRDTVVGAVKRICVDQCGNGSCQEMVCMGEGCPCAESPKTCPGDCK